MIRVLCIFLLFVGACRAEKVPSDITLLVVDLKYNSKQGVKICEVQGSMGSALKGMHAIYGETHFSDQVCAFVKSFDMPLWFRASDFADSALPNRFEEEQFFPFECMQDLYQHPLFVKDEPQDKHALADYSGIVVALLYGEDFHHIHKHYPGILLMNGALFPYRRNKQKMGELFRNDPLLVKLRPKWNVYKTKNAKENLERIKREIGGERFVIKPLNQGLGKGVLIVSKKDLKKTLEMIAHPDTISMDTKDIALLYWSVCGFKEYLVEEFIPSDPIEILGERYNPTMRAVFLLHYDCKHVHCEPLGAYWKLPAVPLGSSGSLSRLHKSRVHGTGYFYPVEEAILQKVEEELLVGLPLIYKKMLGV